MKKMIIIEDESNKKVNNRLLDNKVFEFILSIVCYALILILMSLLFSSFEISNEYFGLFSVVAALIIYVLNLTIKPVLIYLTLPLTGLTFGIFYPFVNVLILYITSFILGDKFIIKGIFVPFVIAILISLLKMMMEGLIIKPIMERRK
ncbi:MAG: phage holin family protein [bacterium]|nr:phage holin family protein [bacterium]